MIAAKEQPAQVGWLFYGRFLVRVVAGVLSGDDLVVFRKEKCIKDCS